MTLRPMAPRTGIEPASTLIDNQASTPVDLRGMKIADEWNLIMNVAKSKPLESLPRCRREAAGPEL